MAKTYRFNPGFQSDAEALENFIVRKDELEEILGRFSLSVSLPPRVVIVAPRVRQPVRHPADNQRVVQAAPIQLAH